MKLHPSIVCLVLGGCGPAGPPPEPQDGRVAMSWTLDGAFLTEERCRAQRIEFMEVEVRSLNGAGRIGFTQVACDLDRYSLTMTPTGRVVLRVGAMGRDGGGQPCLRLSGEAQTTATTAYPATPVRVELKAVASRCS